MELYVSTDISVNMGLILRNIHWISSNSSEISAIRSCLEFTHLSKTPELSRIRKERRNCKLAICTWRQSEFASSATPEYIAYIQGSFIQTIKIQEWQNRIKDSGLGLFSICALMYVVCKLERVARDRQWLKQAEAAEDYTTTSANKKAEFPGSPAHPSLREEQELCYFKQEK